MTENEGTTFYVDAGAAKCPLCQMPMNGEPESHQPSCQLRTLQESYANSLVAASVDACAKFLEEQAVEEYADSNQASSQRCQDVEKSRVATCSVLANYLRSTVTPAEAQAELERVKNAARLEAAKRISTILEGTAFDFRVQTEIHGCIAALEAAARKEE